MKSLRSVVSIKFGLLLGLVNLIIGIIGALVLSQGSTSQIASILLGALSWILTIVFLAMAHYDFNKRNEGYISFGDAVVIGLVVLGIGFIINTAFLFINYQVFLKEKMEQLYSSTYGVQIDPMAQLMAGALSGAVVQIILLFFVITFEAHWKIFRKAGKDGWAAFVPIYNTIVLLEIIKKPAGWVVFMLIPFVNIIFIIWATNLLAKKFGKSESFTAGLIFLPFVFFPMLGLSRAQIEP